MLCCSSIHPAYAPVDTVKNGGKSLKEPTPACACLDSLSDFPGCRRTRHAPATNDAQALIHTLGGALMYSDPNGGEVLSVTVPEGTKSGQTIQVAAPDGSSGGRRVSAVIPSGMQPGSRFTIQLPPASAFLLDGKEGKPVIVTGVPVENELNLELELPSNSGRPLAQGSNDANMRGEGDLKVGRGEMA